VFKPVDPLILRSKVQVFVDLYLKQAEISREAELRHRLQEENFRVRAEKLSAEQALRRRQEHQEEMAKAEAHQRTLIEELNHRVKNMLTVVNAMARQTLASNPEPEVFSEKFIRRIDALGRTHALLSREQWGMVQMADIARESLEHYLVEDKTRVVLKGPPLALDPKTAVALGIVFHELATNAVKHGALSNISGTVTVSWAVGEDQAVALQWQESGGPDVSPPSRAGFGSRLVKLELTHELNGQVELIYGRGGLRVTMGFPLCGDASLAELKQDIAQ
jgi:two-component system, chemotaxis family, CheB/CheR fusion protein